MFLLLMLFFIENWNGDIIQPYVTEKTRLLDLYLSWVIFLFLGGSILITAKSNYISKPILLNDFKELMNKHLNDPDGK
jgi:hypothetical protein